MVMYHKIMVPLDGSDAAEISLPYVEEIAARTEAELTLVSVSDPTREGEDNLYRSYLERVSEQVVSELKDWGVVVEAAVRSKVLVGIPADAIIRYADENDVSLIIMASRGRSMKGPWPLGHIAAKVLRATNRPTLLVRTPVDEMARREHRLVKRILVPLDGSDVGEAALPWAVELAQRLGAEVILYQVVKHVMILATEGAAMSSEIYEEEEKFRRAAAMAYLEKIGKSALEKGLSISYALGSGPPADQIIDYAETNDVDLIAMSTHGRSGISRWVFGSVTDKVLHAGSTGVLTVRAGKGAGS
jgi:nucleotide-binding universal stress UspA family protein